MTNREKLNAMTDEEFAEWLCEQIWDDYGGDPLQSAMRFNHVRNFLKMKAEMGVKHERSSEETDL